MSDADRDFLKLLAATDDPEKKQLTDAAIAEYRKAIEANQLIALKYYIAEPIAQRTFPPGVTRFNIQDKLPAAERGPLLEKVFSFIHANQLPMEGEDDLKEYLTNINRAADRLKTLEAK